jgi:AAA15 family ATPase/GTPase
LGSPVSVKVKNHKCFRDEFAGFDKIELINIIIGRNNSGKSALLDILGFATSKNQTNGEVIKYDDDISEGELKSVFREGTSDGELGGNHWRDHGRHLSGLRVSYEIGGTQEIEINWLNPEIIEKNIATRSYQPGGIANARKKYLARLMNGKRIPLFFKDKITKRLSAERDIRNEPKNDSLGLMNNGTGATNIICNYISNYDLKEELIEKTLLEALNQIFNPDNNFKQISVQHNTNTNEWEVFLSESDKGRIALSSSGSGLKTVILVLLNLLVIHELEKKSIGIENYFFLFEELENNLHPALLRRLFKYIENFAVKNKCHFFITTHSNVVIDQFSKSPNAQIIHVRHDGKLATSATINTFNGHCAVLDDLGAKASDLLQANGIVWLEGPSDRIYFNKWIEIYGNGNLREHRDYECAFYGGSVLKHFEAVEPQDGDDAVNILRVNRNAILIGDSDKTYANKPLKPRLKRIKGEIDAMGGYCWVTEVKEVENYIPPDILGKIFSKTSLLKIGKYEHFYHIPKGKSKDLGYWQKNKFDGQFDKVEFAHKVAEDITRENIENVFDLDKNMKEICRRIKTWNDTKPSSGE